MRNIYAIIIAALGMTAVQAAPQQALQTPATVSEIAANDTIVHVNQAHTVLITQRDSAFVVEIQGQQSDSTYTFRLGKSITTASPTLIEERANRWDFSPLEWVRNGKKRKEEKSKGKPKKDLVMGYGLGFGWLNTYDAPEQWDFCMGRSVELFANVLGFSYTSVNRKHEIKPGVGFKFTRLALSDKQLIGVGDDGVLYPSEYPEGTSEGGSSIKMGTCYVNLIYTRKLPKHWSLSLAPSLNFNFNPRVNSKYKVWHKETKTSVSGISHNVVTADFLATVAWQEVGLYVRYSPWSALDTAYAPKTSSWSLGLSLGF